VLNVLGAGSLLSSDSQVNLTIGKSQIDIGVGVDTWRIDPHDNVAVLYVLVDAQEVVAVEWEPPQVWNPPPTDLWSIRFESATGLTSKRIRSENLRQAQIAHVGPPGRLVVGAGRGCRYPLGWVTGWLCGRGVR